ncbi:polyphenol oxidase I, chloroplastic-like, partial [Triticum urartu]|uniref:polyphenol oxidase I, chloroplastic-like n=1 Tax=Triticum urartu TaxID=4572 RepID=UPI002044A17B
TTNFGLSLAQGADASQCAAVPITAEVLQCVSVPGGFRCPGLYNPSDVVDFSTLPRPRGPPRVRKAAHLLDEADVKRYEEALGRMKALPDDDPRSFKRQSAIHEAYCASHYKVVPAGGGPETVFDVHYSSIFAPWHRMYIYFFEGILGDLVGDPTFGLPYWNWDTPAGMVMPAIFDNKCSPLYNSRRNPARVHGFIDLNLGQPKPDKAQKPKCTDDELICRMEDNLAILYRQMAVSTPKEFYGGKFCSAELDDKGKQQHKVTGSLEAGAHTAAHIWLGDPEQANQDMGDLSTAARDPVFYSNHSNVDRMWHVWSTKLGGPFLPYQEWLDTSFVFYDADKRPVRTKVSDVLDIGKLGYTYEEHGELPWLGKRPKPATGIDRRPGKRSANKVTSSYTTVTLRNDENVYMTVARPEKAWAGGGSGKKAPEALVVDITLDPCEYVKFDVLVNVPKGQEYKVGPRNAEFAGSFTHVPHGRSFGGGMAMIQVSYQFALRELLEDLKSGDDGQLDITIVPVNADEVVIDDARIELL